MSRLVLAFVLPLLLVTWTCASAATIRVPSDQPTIQAGIDVASEGDTVLVAPGTYTGPGNTDLDFNGTNLVLMSEFGAASTIIDCEGNCRGIFMNNGEGPSSVIEGLTIRHGRVSVWTEWPGPGGGGMYIGPSCSPTIRDCHFQACSAAIIEGVYPGWCYGSGGGLYCAGSATLTGCTFSGNFAIDSGGGMACGGSTVLTDCEFYGNSTWYGDEGGGAVHASGSTTLTDCIVSENSSYGVKCSSGDLTLVGCTITGNEEGGVWLRAQTNPVDAVMMNCTIAGNSSASAGEPAAVSCSGDNHVSITLDKCVVALNGGGCAILCSGASTDPVLSCCDIYGNAGGDWVGCIADQYGVDSNFSDDPLFCLEDNPGEPYSLHEGSPCLPENSPCGELVGASGQGCGAVTVVEAVSWGAIKAMFR